MDSAFWIPLVKHKAVRLQEADRAHWTKQQHMPVCRKGHSKPEQHQAGLEMMSEMHSEQSRIVLPHLPTCKEKPANRVLNAK